MPHIVASTASPPALMLATDLDGTFLGGSRTARNQLYRMLEDHPEIVLAWVTGRGLESVLPLLSDPAMPTPKYIICDVGATIVDGATLQPVQPIQSKIENRWPGERPVSQAMSRHAGLTRQNVPQARRCSYFIDPEALSGLRPALEADAAALGCTLLYSADRYLDLLPAEVDKGSTLCELTALLGMDPKHVLVAGDTLNDLSMYVAGFSGVCVGESEASLLEATVEMDHVLHAVTPGCGGILEALRHFRFLDAPTLARDAPAAAGEASLVMVYHRSAYEETVVEGKLVSKPHTSPNGIIPSLLSFFENGHVGTWVSWGVEDRKTSGLPTRSPVDLERYPKLTSARVPLTKAEVDGFYKRFSKEAFWPVIHVHWERARFREEDWRLFKQVNHKFAEVVAAEAAPGATVWLHDYNLWMVPASLRELRPDVRIAFFHHTHFPSADVFDIIPWRREILGSLSMCDYIGFHIPRQVENFVDCMRSAMPVEILATASSAPRFLTYGCAVGIDTYTTALRAGDRTVRLGAHPIGTDIGRIRRCLADPAVLATAQQVRERFHDRKLVLSVERLDYTKGILEKIQAFERLLETEPSQHGVVTLALVCVPPAREMTVYRALLTQIEQAVGRINGRWSRLDWTPVRFFARPLAFDQVVAHFAAADVMWITPLRDGLNLVAKEFAAVCGLQDTAGVLVLSEFAGAAAELKGALLTNPHDPAELASTLLLALTMSADERRDRQRSLFEIVLHEDVEKWSREFLAAAEAEPGVRADAADTAPRLVGA